MQANVRKSTEECIAMARESNGAVLLWDRTLWKVTNCAL
jgi:hypothetical protein